MASSEKVEIRKGSEKVSGPFCLKKGPDTFDCLLCLKKGPDTFDCPYELTRTSGNTINIIFDPDRSKQVQCCRNIVHVQVMQIVVNSSNVNDPGTAIKPGDLLESWRYKDWYANAIGEYRFVDANENSKTPIYQVEFNGTMGYKVGFAKRNATMQDKPFITSPKKGWQPQKGGYHSVIFNFETFAYCNLGPDAVRSYEGITWKYIQTAANHNQGKEGVVAIVEENVGFPSWYFQFALARFIRFTGFKW